MSPPPGDLAGTTSRGSGLGEVSALSRAWAHAVDEAPWLLPAVGITAAVYAVGILLLPFSRLMAPLPVDQFAIGWLSLMGAVAVTGWLGFTAKAVWRREPRPIGAFVSWTKANRTSLLTTALGLALVGLVTMGFNWVKSQLNYALPFWADPLWANIDRAIFGVDPVIPIQAWLGSGIFYVDYVYSLWFPATVLSLSGVFLRRDSRAIVAYFLIWGVFGLTIQGIGSSAGPIFWERIGLGTRFAGVLEGIPAGSRFASDYLWSVYTAGSNRIASGISAMPSLHVAMAAWIAIAYLRTPYAILGVAYWICVFIGSVALGWHYFMDGLVGSLCAAAAFGAAGYCLKRHGSIRALQNRSVAPRSETAALCPDA